MTALPITHLRLAVADCLRSPCPEDRRLGETQRRLWREDPERVAEVYRRATAAEGRMILVNIETRRRWFIAHGLLADRMRELRTRPLWRDRAGMTLAEIAEQAGIGRETLACLMEHHGYLELVPYGGVQNRRLVTDQAFHAELGHNADASHTRIAHLEGRHRACIFPVFYPEHVPSILWTLDYEGIVESATTILSKKERLRWLLAEHGHLPDTELARLSGYSRRGIEKMRERETRSPALAKAA